MFPFLYWSCTQAYWVLWIHEKCQKYSESHPSSCPLVRWACGTPSIHQVSMHGHLWSGQITDTYIQCMHACMCGCVYVCMDVCIYLRVCVCMSLSLSTYMCMYIYIYICVCVCIYIYICIYMHIYIYVHTCTVHMYIVHQRAKFGHRIVIPLLIIIPMMSQR